MTSVVEFLVSKLFSLFFCKLCSDYFYLNNVRIDRFPVGKTASEDDVVQAKISRDEDKEKGTAFPAFIRFFSTIINLNSFFTKPMSTFLKIIF